MRKNIAGSQQGLFGIRLILILAIVGGLAIWAYKQGYLKWKGPKPVKAAKELKNDVTDTVEKAQDKLDR